MSGWRQFQAVVETGNFLSRLKEKVMKNVRLVWDSCEDRSFRLADVFDIAALEDKFQHEALGELASFVLIAKL